MAAHRKHGRWGRRGGFLPGRQTRLSAQTAVLTRDPDLGPSAGPTPNLDQLSTSTPVPTHPPLLPQTPTPDRGPPLAHVVPCMAAGRAGLARPHLVSGDLGGGEPSQGFVFLAEPLSVSKGRSALQRGPSPGLRQPHQKVQQKFPEPLCPHLREVGRGVYLQWT